RLYDAKGYLVDSISYAQFCPELPDTIFTLALSHPDSSTFDRNWNMEVPTPGIKNKAYDAQLRHEADKSYWTKVFYVGGGSFFFISVAGIFLRRYFRRRKKA